MGAKLNHKLKQSVSMYVWYILRECHRKGMLPTQARRRRSAPQNVQLNSPHSEILWPLWGCALLYKSSLIILLL